MAQSFTNASPKVRLAEVTKTYKLYHSPRDRLKEAFFPGNRIYHRPFNALQDVSLEIMPATTVGIIGRNGSGKSTLLQCICGIVPTTQGSVEINGRIAALLELGAGFNPEFTGRDNLYINASILGLEREQVDQRLDKILAFADIGEYIDQPVRAYSSGMYVRLAFSIAIHVDPEILIVDEALAVGDIHFQAKCFDRFHQFREQGVTVIFVTHDLNMVTRYCDQAYLLSHGKIVAEGNPREVVAAYRKVETGHALESKPAQKKQSQEADHQEEQQTQDQQFQEQQATNVFAVNPYETRYGNNKATIIGGGIYNAENEAVQILHSGDPYRVSLEIRFEQPITNPVFAFTIKDVKGTDIAGTNTHFSGLKTGEFVQDQKVTVDFQQAITLTAGSYLLSFGCVSLESDDLEIYDRRHDYISFQVTTERPTVGIVDLNSEISISS